MLAGTAQGRRLRRNQTGCHDGGDSFETAGTNFVGAIILPIAMHTVTLPFPLQRNSGGYLARQHQNMGARLTITGLGRLRAPVAERRVALPPSCLGSPSMLGDPKECRSNAARCTVLAVAARTPQLRTTLLELSKNWEKLAIQMEDALAKLAESEGIGSKVRKTIDEARWLRKK